MFRSLSGMSWGGLAVLGFCTAIAVFDPSEAIARGSARISESPADRASEDAVDLGAENPPAPPSPAPLPSTTVAGVHPGFVVVPELKRQVEFWKRIYSQYDTRQAVIHDSRCIDVIYEVIQYGSGESHKQSTRRVKAAKERWRKALLGYAKKLSKMEGGGGTQTPESPETDDERHLVEIFKGCNEPNRYLNAAHRKRLRVQLGQKDRFMEGYVASGRYLPLMEEVFKKEGLPLELTRLPFVESSFNLKARSKVGASGVWQFMRSTGRRYLRIKGGLDERNDPIRATEAAAKLLKQNYESLGNWPLAVTAYNHGRMGLMRAVRQTGSDQLEDILVGYRSRSFGFASSNFFACLLAAIDLEKNAEAYFGKLTPEPLLRAFEVKLPQAILVTELNRYFKYEPARLRELNPGLSEAHWKGRERLPAGYRLRLPLPEGSDPEKESRLFLVGYEQIPRTLKGPSVKSP